LKSGLTAACQPALTALLSKKKIANSLLETVPAGGRAAERPQNRIHSANDSGQS
jgi:hypothetical protein